MTNSRMLPSDPTPVYGPRSLTTVKPLVGLLAVLALALAPGKASAQLLTTLSFFNITNNNPINAAAGEAQLFVDVIDAGSGMITFTFRNVGPAASSIVDIYFDDNNGLLLGPPVIVEGPGTMFSSGAVAPPDLPGGNTASPPFVATTSLSADSDPPSQPNGVNPGEFVSLTYTLTGSIAALLADLTDGDLRIGIHVQGFGDGGSESFINNPPGVTPPPGAGIPEPASVVLAGLGLCFLSLVARRRRA